ncbi:MAG: hypothetical protein AAGK22_13620 [Acidobacteriota bacterium]
MTEDEDSHAAADADSRFSRNALALLVLAWLAGTAALLVSDRTLFLRDVFTLHLHQKHFGALQLAQGQVPYFQPDGGLSQPFRANPNVLPLYPGNLLYLILPFWTAFNLHYLLHWLVALLAMRALARAIGLSPLASVFAALTYAGSGVLASSLSFYNLLTVAAWWPAVMAGVLVRDRRGAVLAGFSCALAIYGGEPFTLLIGVPPLLWLAVQTHGLRLGLLRSVTAGGLGLALAAPQIVAVLRTVSFTARGALGASDTNLFVFHPIRLLELLVPSPFGHADQLGADRYLLGRLGEQEPFFSSLHFGVVALPLLMLGWRRHRGMLALAVAALLLATFGDRAEGVLSLITFGLFRFPEKFLFIVALTLPLVAAQGLDHGDAVKGGRHGTWIWLALCAPLWLLTFAYGAPITQWLAGDLTQQELGVIGDARKLAVLQSLGISAAFLLVAELLLRHQRTGSLLALQAVACLRLIALAPSVDAAPFQREPDWHTLVGDGARVVSSTYEPLFGAPPPTYLTEATSKAFYLGVAHEDLDFSTGRLHALEYPYMPDFEGLGTPFQLLVFENLKRLPWSAKVNWLRTAGVDFVTVAAPPEPGRLEPVASTLRSGAPTQLLSVPSPAPPTWWPRAVNGNESPIDALEQVSVAEDPIDVVTVAGPSSGAQGRGAATLLRNDPDRIELTTTSEQGGIVAVRRGYHPLWQARNADGHRLPVKALNLVLMGVEVPAGEQTVVLAVDKSPDRAAYGLAGVALLGSLFSTKGI